MLSSSVYKRVSSPCTPQAMYFYPSTDTETVAPWLQNLTSCTRSCDAATSCFATTSAIASFSFLASMRLMG